MLIQLTDRTIEIEEALVAVRHPSCGAVATFQGDIRNTHDGKKVLGLEYEVHGSFFRAEVLRIFGEIRERWKIHEIALIQRVGKLDLGETGIVIAISSSHRREALEALSYGIEEFKKRAPVWKKEYYAEGAEWIHGASLQNVNTPKDFELNTA